MILELLIVHVFAWLAVVVVRAELGHFRDDPTASLFRW